jgi:Tol biopolymer transport system component
MVTRRAQDRVRSELLRLEGRRSQIYVMRADGSGARNISARHDDLNPSWSPDGKLIAFRKRTGVLWVLDANGSNRREVRTATGNRIDSITDFPLWSHDGTEIDFTGTDPDTFDTPKSGVWAVNVETGALRMLFGQDVTPLEWSPRRQANTAWRSPRPGSRSRRRHAQDARQTQRRECLPVHLVAGRPQAGVHRAFAARRGRRADGDEPRRVGDDEVDEQQHLR